MSYYNTMLGKFAGTVASVVDIDGYVPEEGDTPDMFRYDEPNAWTNADGTIDLDAWNEHVARAVALTAEASADASGWRQ